MQFNTGWTGTGFLAFFPRFSLPLFRLRLMGTRNFWRLSRRSPISSRKLKGLVLAFLLSLLALNTRVTAADSCGSGVSASDFPGIMIIEVRKTEIGIGSVAPFIGGSGRIVAVAGPLINGVATFEVKPDAFQIKPFLFPFIFSWKTTLTAMESGRGQIKLSSSGEFGVVSLDILLRAKNRLGKLWLRTNFTTGKSPPVRIADEDYDAIGDPLGLESGDAVLIATGKTSSESHLLFRRDDFYARAEVCIHFEVTGNN